MKTENTQENKAKFLSQYQFAHVCFDGISNSVWHIETCLVRGYFVNNGDKGLIKINDTTPLLLKSLKNISDEEAIEACKIGYQLAFGGNNTVGKWKVTKSEHNFLSIKCKYSVFSFEFDLEGFPLIDMYQDDELSNVFSNERASDFLRSKGYLLPYLDITINDMINYGWAKTK